MVAAAAEITGTPVLATLDLLPPLLLPALIVHHLAPIRASQEIARLTAVEARLKVPVLPVIAHLTVVGDLLRAPHRLGIAQIPIVVAPRKVQLLSEIALRTQIEAALLKDQLPLEIALRIPPEAAPRKDQLHREINLRCQGSLHQLLVKTVAWEEDMDRDRLVAVRVRQETEETVARDRPEIAVALHETAAARREILALAAITDLQEVKAWAGTKVWAAIKD